MQNWWEKDEIVAPPGGGIVTRAADPARPFETQIKDYQARAAPFDLSKAQSDAEIARQNAAYAAQLAQAKAAEARANADKAQAEAQQGGLTKDKQDEFNQRRARLDALAEQIKRVDALHDTNLRGGWPNAIAGRVPFRPSNDEFNKAAAGLLDVGQGAFRIPGSGDQNMAELGFKLDAYKPSSTDSDAAIDESMGYLKLRVDEERKALGLPPTDWNARPGAPALTVQPGEGIDQSTQFRLGPQDVAQQRQTASRDGTKTIEVPRLKAIGNQLSRMVASGASDEQIRKFMRDAKLPPAQADNTEKILQFRRTKEFQDWRKANPHKPYPIAPTFWQMEVPLGGGFMGESFQNDAALSAPGTALTGFARGMTADHMDELAGMLGADKDQLRANMTLQEQEHPYAAMGGQILGQAALEFGGGRAIPGAARFAANPWGRRATDAAVGGLYGHGAADDNASLSNIALSGFANTAGGMAGRGLQSGTGKALTGVKDETLKYLNDEGISLTPGQIFRASDSPAGRAVAWTEDRLRGLPGTDAMIGTAQHRGAEDFNQAMFRQGSGGVPIAATGEQGVEQLGQGVSDAYRQALNGVSVARDKPFTQAFTQATRKGSSLKLLGDDFKTTVDDVKGLFDQNGQLSGENIQAAIQTVQRARAANKGQPGYIAYARELRNVENALVAMVNRQRPDVMPGLNRANILNRDKSIIRNAVRASPSQRNEGLVSPTQLNQAAIQNSRKYGGEDFAVSTNRPFYNLSTRGMQIIPGEVPDSGTAGRAALVPLLGAGLAAGGEGVQALSGNDTVDAAGGYGQTLGMLALGASVPYSKFGQATIQKAALGSRPAAINALGELLQKYPELAGLLGGYGARQLASPDPYQP